MNDLKGIIEDCNKSDLVSKEAIKKVIEIIGQEEWNDLYDGHSNICTTMGELIITLKGIADIEKENKELKTIKIPQLERRIASIRGAHSVDCKKLNARIEQVERLKNENAKLKEKVETYQIGMFDEIEKRDKRLTKAEEILREYIRINLLPPTERNFDDEVKLFIEAEQFLN